MVPGVGEARLALTWSHQGMRVLQQWKSSSSSSSNTAKSVPTSPGVRWLEALSGGYRVTNRHRRRRLQSFKIARPQTLLLINRAASGTAGQCRGTLHRGL